MPEGWAATAAVPEADFRDSCYLQPYPCPDPCPCSYSCLYTHCGTARDANPIITMFLEIEREILAARLDDTARLHHVHKIRFNIVEHALVVCHQDNRVILIGKLVHATGNNPECIDIKTRVGLVKNREPRLQQRHLQYLITFFFTAGKPFIDPAIKKIRVHFQQFHLLAHEILKLERIKFLLATLGLHRVISKPQKMTIRNAWYFNRVLKGEKHAGTSAFFWFEIEQILAFERD